MQERKQFLLEKFLHDQCTHEELKELLSYLKNDNEKEYDEILRRVWEELQVYPLLDETTIGRISANVSSRIKNKKDTTRVRPLIFRPWLFYAATLTGLLMILGLVYFLLPDPSSRIEYKTAYGETMKVILPDSTIVTLNGNSQLSYAPVWDPPATREVWLAGEAFFEVRRKAENETNTTLHQQNNMPEGQKFVVHTANFNVEVLGTSFNVNDRGDRASVVLSIGKVRLQKNNERADIMMKPGDRVALSGKSNDLVTKTVDPDLYTAWTKNKLIFERTPLSEIAQLLEDNYGLEVTLKGENLQERIFTATIPTIQVDVLLTILEESMQVNITKEGNRVIIE